MRNEGQEEMRFEAVFESGRVMELPKDLRINSIGLFEYNRQLSWMPFLATDQFEALERIDCFHDKKPPMPKAQEHLIAFLKEMLAKLEAE